MKHFILFAISVVLILNSFSQNNNTCYYDRVNECYVEGFIQAKFNYKGGIDLAIEPIHSDDSMICLSKYQKVISHPRQPSFLILFSMITGKKVVNITGIEDFNSNGIAREEFILNDSTKYKLSSLDIAILFLALVKEPFDRINVTSQQYEESPLLKLLGVKKVMDERLDYIDKSYVEKRKKKNIEIISVGFNQLEHTEYRIYFYGSTYIKRIKAVYKKRILKKNMDVVYEL